MYRRALTPVSRGPGKLQREILRVVEEYGPITTGELADLVVGPPEYDPNHAAWMVARHGEKGAKWMEEIAAPWYALFGDAGDTSRYPTVAYQTRRRNCRRAVASLIKSGRLVEKEALGVWAARQWGIEPTVPRWDRRVVRLPSSPPCR